MGLSPSQLTALKNAITADPALSVLPHTPDNAQVIADAFNALASPDYWVWRTSVSRVDIYNETSPDGTNWNWITYKNQGVAEQNAWVQMFMGDQANFAKANVRAGIAAIFTGSAQANAQRDHCLACGRRQAKRAEKLFAAATSGGVGQRGSTANPDTLTFEGNLSYQDVLASWDV